MRICLKQKLILWLVLLHIVNDVISGEKSMARKSEVWSRSISVWGSLELEDDLGWVDRLESLLDKDDTLKAIVHELETHINTLVATERNKDNQLQVKVGL